MTTIDLIDLKGEQWQLIHSHTIPYLHKGEKYWKAWWFAPVRPDELRNYDEVPLPIFTDWWTNI